MVLLPDGAPELDAPMGIPVGPPSTEELGLPEEVQVRLHNALVERGLLTEGDIKRRRGDIVGAIQAALGLYVRHITRLYAFAKDEDAQKPARRLPARTRPLTPLGQSLSTPSPSAPFVRRSPPKKRGKRSKETT